MKSILALLLALALPLCARPWTNTDGKTIEADFISSDTTSVTLLLGGKEIKYPLEKLSKADIDWIAAQAPPEAKQTAKDTATGLLKNVPISASLFPETMDHFKDRTRRASLKDFEDGAFKHSGPSEPWLVRDFEKDLCDIYVPKSYDGSQPYGLLLYISASDDPKFLDDWFALFDEKKLIAVTARLVGNKTRMPRRVLLSVDALATVEKLYKVDPERRVVTGISGGGHMSMLTGALYPELFKGAISYAAQSYLPGGGGFFGHFPGLALSDFKSKDRRKMKWVVISGDKDYNYQAILETSKGWDAARLDYRFIDVPGMGHTPAAAPDIKTALDWMGL